MGHDDETQDTGAPNVGRVIRKMDSSELLRQAGLLAELQRHPGWQVLTDLMDVQRASVTHRLDRAGTPNASQVATSLDDLVKQAGLQAFAGGTVRGIDTWRQVLDMVQNTAERVRRALEAEGDEDDGDDD